MTDPRQFREWPDERIRNLPEDLSLWPLAKQNSFREERIIRGYCRPDPWRFKTRPADCEDERKIELDYHYATHAFTNALPRRNEINRIKPRRPQESATLIVDAEARSNMATAFAEPPDFARDFDSRLNVTPAELMAGAPVAITPTPWVWRDPTAIPTREWLYGRRLIRKFVSATIAPAGVGKSSLGLAEDVAMTSGRALLGQCVASPLRVWTWNGEDPLDELERRIAAICLHYGVTPQEIGDRLFVDSGRQTEIIIARAARNGLVIAEPIVDAVKRSIRRERLDVLRIDPFVSCHRVVENDNVAIDAVAKEWAKIADDTGCAIELVHHARKTNGAEVSVEDARGASALLGAVRSARVLNTMTKDEAAQAGVERRREYFRADDGKSNLAPPSDASEWFHIVSQPLGNGGDVPGDFVGVVTPWSWPSALDGLCVDDLRRVRDRIADGEWAENSQSANWAGYAVAEVLALDAGASTDKARIKSMLRTWIANGVLKVERRRSARDGRDRPMIVPGDRV